MKAIVGAELTIQAPGPRPRAPGRKATRSSGALGPGPVAWTLPVLVSSSEGYRNLCRIITRAKLKAPKGESALTLEDLAGHTTGLIALAGRQALDAARHGVGGLIDRLVGIFGGGQVWIELQRHLRRDEQAGIQSLLDLAGAFRVPVMASNGVRFATADARPLYDVLTCIRQGVTLEQAGQRLSSNAERYLKPPELMARLFSDLPQALAGTEALAERLDFTLANLGYRFPDYPVPDGESQATLSPAARTGGRARPVSAVPRSRPGPDRARARSHRKARTGRLLSHCLGHRQFLPAAGHSRAGPRVGGQQRRLLCPRDHRGRSGRHGSAVRAISVGRTRGVAGHRSGSAERRSARAGHPVRLRALREDGRRR